MQIDDWGPTNNTCAVWTRGRFMGTFHFPDGVAAAWNVWRMGIGLMEAIKDGDFNFDHMLDYWIKHGLALRTAVDLKYSPRIEDHWWCGPPPDFFPSLVRTEASNAK